MQNQKFMPHSWGFKTDEWIRVGFEDSDLVKAFDDEEMLGEIAKYFGMAHNVNPSNKIFFFL